MSEWPAKWIVYIYGMGPEHFSDREQAEAYAINEANDTPDLEVAIYELSAVACAKVAKAKLRGAP